MEAQLLLPAYAGFNLYAVDSKLFRKMKMRVTLLSGDAGSVLKTLPSESVDCVVTSPPYWALRDYGVSGQLGVEPDFRGYLRNLCRVFDEVKRVLKKEGTCWVNLGDTYCGNKAGKTDNKVCDYLKKTSKKINKTKDPVIKEKSLLQIPSRFAIEMTNRGWILRNEIIWYKPNAMPSSVKDRFTADYEKLFFFTKAKKYYFEQQFEPLSEASLKDLFGSKSFRNKGSNNAYVCPGEGRDRREFYNPRGRNKRCVWTIPTKPYKGAHFAPFPLDLAVIPIRAGCPNGGIVLDPFIGSGTTAIAALINGCDCVGIDVNQKYLDIARERIFNETGVNCTNERLDGH